MTVADIDYEKAWKELRRIAEVGARMPVRPGEILQVMEQLEQDNVKDLAISTEPVEG